jgi:hypothetical protein
MTAMKASLVPPRAAAGAFAALLLAACATESNSSSPAVNGQPVVSTAAVARLAPGLTGAEVRALLGAPAATKPVSSGGANSLIWSYPLGTATEVRSVPVTTQEVPAFNPFSGTNTTRTETVYQNQTVLLIDTLHLLMVNDRLVEWRVVREEKSQSFH